MPDAPPPHSLTILRTADGWAIHEHADTGTGTTTTPGASHISVMGLLAAVEAWASRTAPTPPDLDRPSLWPLPGQRTPEG